MGHAKQQRIGGGLTNKAHLTDTLPPRTPLSRPATGESQSAERSAEAAPRSRPATGSSLGGSRAIYTPTSARGQAVGGFSREQLGADTGLTMRRDDQPPMSSRKGSGRRPDLFGPAVAVRSRPHTAPSRSSSRQGAWGREEEAQGRDVNLRPETGVTESSQTSSVIEGKLVDFQKSFQNKNGAKFHKMQEAFRRADVNKQGLLGEKEVAAAMSSLDIQVDKAVIARLLERCEGGVMNFQQFRDQLWIDDRMTTYIDERKNFRAGSKGDNSGSKYLWTPLKLGGNCVGTFNDTLEADRIQAGTIPPRLDGNFSSVRYDIISLDKQPRGMPPGENPYDVVTLKTPRHPGDESTERFNVFQAPVRIVTFSRVHRGEYPTQQAHMLTNAFT